MKAVTVVNQWLKTAKGCLAGIGQLCFSIEAAYRFVEGKLS